MNNRSIRWGLTAALALVPSLSAQGGLRWYADINTGDDLNPGTAALPVRTCNEAINRAGAGDTIYVWPGTYDAAAGEAPTIICSVPVQVIGIERNFVQPELFTNFVVQSTAAGARFEALNLHGVGSTPSFAPEVATQMFGQPVTIQNCRSQDADVYLGDNWILDRCLVAGGGVMDVSSGPIGARVSGNTIANSTGTGITTTPWTTVGNNNVVGHNVGIDATNGPSGGFTQPFSGNNTWGNGTDWALPPSVQVPPGNHNMDPQFFGVGTYEPNNPGFLDSGDPSHATGCPDLNGRPPIDPIGQGAKPTSGAYELFSMVDYNAIQLGDTGLALSVFTSIPSTAFVMLGVEPTCTGPVAALGDQTPLLDLGSVFHVFSGPASIVPFVVNLTFQQPGPGLRITTQAGAIGQPGSPASPGLGAVGLQFGQRRFLTW